MPKVELISRDESFEVGDAEHGYRIRRIPPDLVRELRKRHSRRAESRELGAEIIEVDETEVDKDLLDYIIQGWWGVEDPKEGEPPCTREHKWRLPAAEKNMILMKSGAVNTRGELAGDLKKKPASSEEPAPEGGSKLRSLTRRIGAPSAPTAS